MTREPPAQPDRAITDSLPENGRRGVPPGATAPADAALEAAFRAAVASQQRGDNLAAQAYFQRVLAVRPTHLPSLHMLAVLHYRQGNLDEALREVDRALALAPRIPALVVQRGLTQKAMGDAESALASFDAALAIDPRSVGALVNRGNLLQDLLRPIDAIACYDQALAAQPNSVEAHYNRGTALLDLDQLDEALASFDHALALRPDQPQALSNRGTVLQALRRHGEAAACFARLEEIAPRHPFTPGRLLHARMLCCDWRDYDARLAKLTAAVLAGEPAAEPFGFQGVAPSDAAMAACSRTFGALRYPLQVPEARSLLLSAKDGDGLSAMDGAPPRAARRIRLAYLSGEFRSQATSILMAEVFERHDRDRFELIAFDNGPADSSTLRRRIEAAFHVMVDIRPMTDAAAADAVAGHGVDILVDLNGYFGRSRLGVLSRRPSPIQVNYLGFPGTLGLPYVDYIIADATVIPSGHEAFFDEKVVRLPDCYQPNDRLRTIASQAPTRSQVGLPAEGFVFCCFNNNYKITPPVFSVWMRLLTAVPGSVLWLLADNPDVMVNLRREAGAQGIDPGRLVFADRIEPDDHLARHQLADLFLDTLPYNAHTTASDSLWAGLPVLTCVGATFAGRVAASLLEAIGLPQLITTRLDDYEALAIRLARDPALLAGFRATLARNRDTHPLFDSARVCRQLEAAYTTMWQRHQRGEPAAAFDVPASG